MCEATKQAAYLSGIKKTGGKSESGILDESKKSLHVWQAVE